VIKESNKGIELEVMQAAVEAAGHTLVPKYLGGKGMWNNLKAGKVDAAVMNASYDARKNLNMDVFYSDTTVTYQNYAISLQESGFNINRIQDLQDKRVVAFFNASKVLGAEFGAMAKANKNYNERPKQLAQVKALYSGNSNVAIGDKNIFQYFRQQAGRTIDVSKPLTMDKIFAPSPRRLIFVNKGNRDIFNKGLKLIRENGAFDAIIDRYSNELNRAD